MRKEKRQVLSKGGREGGREGEREGSREGGVCLSGFSLRVKKLDIRKIRSTLFREEKSLSVGFRLNLISGKHTDDTQIEGQRGREGGREGERRSRSKGGM